MSPIKSLAGRLLLASALLLPLFLGFTGLYLERGHRLGAEAAEAERLQLLLLTLLAEAEYEQSLWLPEQLLEARFNQPASGLYAAVTGPARDLLWQSLSSRTTEMDPHLASLPRLNPGQRDFSRQDGLFRFSYQVLWQTEAGAEIPLLFSILETVVPLDAAVSSYRRSLLLWLGGSAILLLACQAAILAWGLRPLRTLARDLGSIESGDSDQLSGAYPNELQSITDNLNTLLHSEKERRAKVRNTLSDLAHSLKTPLAVISSADREAPDYPDLVREQTRHMEQIVSYQLQRASGGSHKLLQVIDVPATVRRLQSGLEKVYADRRISFQAVLAPGSVFRGDERDLLELLGNLMDNACKYGRKTVRVTVAGGGRLPLEITVEDDGEGISAELDSTIMQRGIRADSRSNGQGIGLAVVADIVESYRGELRVEPSALGGACLRVILP